MANYLSMMESYNKIYLLCFMMWIPFCGSLEGQNVCKRVKAATDAHNNVVDIIEFFCCAGYKAAKNRCVELTDSTQVNCPLGYCGKGCLHQCACTINAHCDSDKCCVCNKGFTGQFCDTPCAEGYYGEGCMHTCLCSNHSSCDRITGICLCDDGWTGDTCTDVTEAHLNVTCSPNCNCQDPRCSINGSDCQCYLSNETAQEPKLASACPAGYFGQNCSIPCLGNTYGQQCKLTCYCTGDELCDPKAGCKCKAGYAGANCDKVCSVGFYGPSCIYECECSKTSVCNKKTGECTCDKGWIGKHCDNKCASGYYGIGCANRCSCSANHQCHHVTGDCHCETGKQGSHCNETCDAGKYGMGCLKICSCQDCNPVDGVCQPIDNDGITVGIIVGVVVGILVLVVSLFIIVLKCRTNSKDRHQLQQKKRGDCSSNYYEDIDDYAEIPDSKLHPNYPYSYADSNDVKPPIIERIPTTKRKTNQYLSLTEAQILSKLSATSGELKSHGGSTDYLNPYTGLLKDAKCASYQDINKETKERKSSSESIQSESGYVKIASGTTEGTTETKDGNKRQCNDYTDAPPSTRYSNGSDLDRLTTESRIEKGISIQSGFYLKMNSTLKREAKTEADRRTLNIDDKGSQKNVCLPKITVSSQSGSTETLNIKNQ